MPTDAVPSLPLTIILSLALLLSLLTGCGEEPPPATGLSLEKSSQFEQQGDIDKALAELNRLPAPIRRSAAVSPALQRLYHAGIKQAESERDWQQALELATNMLRDFPDDGWSRVKRGIFERNTGNARAALVQFDQALKLDTEYRTVALEKAITLVRMRRFQQAWNILETLHINHAEQQQPSTETAQIIYYKSRAAAGLGQQQDNRALLEQLLAMAKQKHPATAAKPHPAVPGWNWFRLQALVGLADADRLAGNLPQARARIDAVLRIAPNSALATRIKGEIEKESGNAKQAISAFEESLKRNPNNIVLRRKVFVSYLSQGDLAAARKQLEAAQRSRPKHPMTKMMEAEMVVRQGDCRAGMELLTTALRQRPKDARSNAMMARCRYRSEEYQQAREHARFGLDAPDLYLETLNIYAKSLYATGEQQYAWKVFRKHAKSDPNVYLTAALAALQLGANKPAVAFLQSAVGEADSGGRKRAEAALDEITQKHIAAAISILQSPTAPSADAQK